MDSSNASISVRSRWSCVDERDSPSEPISPELVLVDPELARRVRAVAVVGPPPPVARISEISIAEMRPRADRRPPRLRLAVTAAGAAASVALVTFATAAVPGADELPYIDASPPAEHVAEPAGTVATTRTQTTDAAVAKTPSQTTDAPVATTREAMPPHPESVAANVVLRWQPLPSADYYNVILWSDGARLRDYWPRQPSIVIVTRELARLGVPNGSTVHWFVYPIRLEAGTRVAGPVRANGSFTVRAPAAR